MEDSENQNSSSGELTIIPTKDLKRSYTLESIMTLYILSSDPIEKFAERYRLNPDVILKYARQGRWDELRAAHTEKAMELFRMATATQVEDSIDLEIKLQSLRNIQTEQAVARLAAHYEKYGHLNMVNLQTRHELLDPAGFPIPLRIPASAKAAHELIQNLQKNLEELVTKNKAIEDEKRLAGARPVNVEDYDHVFKSDDGANE
jgi:hypothetical protein